jgi:hypothetical protein
MRRRDFLGLSGVALTAAAWPFADRDWRALAQGTQRPRLSMPPLLDTRKTGKLSLVAQTGQTSFAGGPPNLTAGYNSGFMGPTIVMQNGALDARVGFETGERAQLARSGLDLIRSIQLQVGIAPKKFWMGWRVGSLGGGPARSWSTKKRPKPCGPGASRVAAASEPLARSAPVTHTKSRSPTGKRERR